MNSSLTMLWRHFTSGRLNILLAALIIATASLAAITMVAGSVHNTIIQQAHHSLAADVQVRGSKAIPTRWLELSRHNNLSSAQSVQFRAMAFSEHASILASVKAVSDEYPLLGDLTVSDTPYGAGSIVTSGPPVGEAWLSPRLFANLNIQPGSTVEIGENVFIAAKSLVREPDNLQSAFNAAPRVLIHMADVAATGAIQLGSRVDYTLMLAGSEAELANFRSTIKLGPDFRWRTIEDSNERLAATLNKATQFIRLGGLLSIILAAIGIAVATRTYVAEQIPQVALLKTLGATPKKVLRLYATHVAIIATVGTATGLALGVLLYQIIKIAIRALLTDLASPDFTDLLFAAALSVSVFIVFAAPYFFYLHKISPLVVLQQSSNAELLNNWRSLFLGSLAAFTLCVIFTGNVTLTVYVFLGLLICCGLAVLGGLAIIYAAAYLAQHAGPIIKLGIANLVRHKLHTAPQIMMFSILFMLIFTLIMMRTSLLDTWRAQLPEHAPNHYIYNIFDSHKSGVLDTLRRHGIEQQPVYPIFGGRLIKVNSQPAKVLVAQAENRVNYEREFGLTWSTAFGSDNQIISGGLWDGQESELLVSVEEDFAKGLNLEVGDNLTLAIGGSPVSAQVHNIRTVQWDSMNLNFYLIFNKPPTDVLNANWATSFYLGTEQKDVVNLLARAHPTISIIELDQTIQQVKDIINRVSLSIELITLLILGSGCVILVANVQSTYRTRLQEGAILRTFGASKRTVQRLNFVEFGAIGLISGLLATVGSETVLWLLSRRILQAEPVLHWPLWLFGPVVVMMIIVMVTTVFTRQLHQQTPMSVLKSI